MSRRTEAGSFLDVDTGTAIDYPITWAVRIKLPPTTPAGRIPVSYGEAYPAWDAEYSGISLGAAGFSVTSGQGATFVGAPGVGTIVGDQWYLLVGVWESATSRTSYVDNGSTTAVGTGAAGAHTHASKHITLGDVLISPGGALGGYQTAAEYADFALWNAVLTPADVDALAAGRPGDVKPESLKAWYKLGEDGDLSSSVGSYSAMTIYAGTAPVTADPPYAVAGIGDIKTVSSVPVASIKTFLNIPRASIKTINALAMGGAPAGPTIPADGLGVWYKADEGVFTRAAAQFVPANSEYLSRPSNSSLRFGNIPWTIGGWFNIDTHGVNGLLMKGIDGTNYDYTIYSLADGTMVLQAYNGTTQPSLTLPGAVVLNTWRFLIGSYDPAGGGLFSLQVDNGTVVTSGTPTGVLIDNATGGLILGGFNLAAPGAFLAGRMQNWFMFGRALTATERSFLYNAGAGRRYEELDTAFKANLRAWWPLSEWSGSRVDLSGNNNTLTDNNTVLANVGHVYNSSIHNSPLERWEDFSPNAFHVVPATGAPAWMDNIRNGLPVVRFNGTTAAMVSSNAAITGSSLCGAQAQTIFAVMWQSAADLESTLYRWDSSGGDLNALSGHFGWTDGQFYWYTGQAIGAADGNVHGPEPAGWRATWHVLELVRDGTTGTIWVDGVNVPMPFVQLTGTFNTAGVHPFRIAYDERTGRHFQGDLAELIVYNRTLSLTERDAVREYLQEKWAFAPSDIAGLQAWYKADEGVYSRSAAQLTAANLEYLSIPSNSSLVVGGGTAFTMGGWVRGDSVSGTANVLIGKRGAAVNQLEYQIHWASGVGIIGNMANSTGTYYSVISPPTIPSAATWYFVVFSYNPADSTFHMQIDNATAVSAAFSGTPLTGTFPVGLGVDISGPTYSFDGRMQNWFVFGRLLDSTERSFLYNSGNGRSYEELDSAFKTNLRAWWPLDETSGSRRDLSGNANTLTDNNTVGEADGKVLNAASNGVKIYQWSDLSGGNRHLTRATLVERPVYLTGVQNGLSVAQFDGIAQSITGSWAGHNVGTVFTAMRYQGTLPLSFQAWLMSNTPSYGIIFRGTGPGWDTSFASLLTFFRDGVASAAVDNAWHNYVATGSPLGNSLLLVGNDPAAGGRFWYGQGGEIIIYDTQLSAGDRALVENYLRAKWGLP